METIDREEKGTRCERCAKAIKWVYVCRVDADAPQLAALPNAQQVWRIGSTCGPTLLMVSEEVWSGATKERFAAIQLIWRANRVLELAASLGDKDWALKFIDERTKKLFDGPLPSARRSSTTTATPVALHFMHYNFCRKHQSLKGRTPAMAAGVADHVWSLEELVALIPEKTGRFERIGSAAE